MSANNRFVLSILAAGAMATLALAMMRDAYAAGPKLAATFTATTANMTPAGVNLRLQILEWQEAGARTEAVASMVAGDKAATPLTKLPTVGYVWPDGSPVGYSVKYAYRSPAAGGGARITLVTDRQIGSYDFKGWSVPSPAAKGDAPYSVIELYVDGAGAGTGSLSLAAEVLLDEETGKVALADGAPTLLTNVERVAAAPY